MNAPAPGSRPAGVTEEAEAARSIREMFSRIAPRYDLLNHLLSFSFDRLWRRRTARRLAPRLAGPAARGLDLCCGTGDLTLALARAGRAQVVGVDFAHTMLVRARSKSRNRSGVVDWVEADALRLPFADASFDVATAGFGFRNLANYRKGLAEIHRVLKPGGEVGILEFVLPERGWFASLYRFYFRRILPRVGSWISGVRGPYSYLPASVAGFPDCAELAQWMEAQGFREVRFTCWTGGTVALHQGRKA